MSSCPYCGWNTVEERIDVVGCDFINPDIHMVTVKIDYFCYKCMQEYEGADYDTYTESHDYEMIEETGVLICGGCGDSYEKIFFCMLAFILCIAIFSVIVEDGRDTYEDVVVYKEKTIEIGAGGGPDIMMVGTSVNFDSVYELMKKGVFENLAPYMEQSGIEEENYFPMAFDGLRDGDNIYGLTVMMSTYGLYIDEAVLGDKEISNAEGLLDILLAYDKEAVFVDMWDSELFVEQMLKPSEMLFGAVDWEGGTCDFGGEVFSKLCRRQRGTG